MPCKARPARGEENGPVAALEQLHTKAFFKQTHLAADGAMGDMQVLGGAHEALGFGGDVEVAEGIEWRQFHGICVASTGLFAGLPAPTGFHTN
ncbi:hypothetical protein PPS11_00755 [Pseudomonas putida S11]|nr:hypothetical protein PPS11_00755 [Pseudomonas putida S11]